MTTPQVHFLMIGLGILAYVLIAGQGSGRNRQSHTRRRKWWLGASAGLLIALSPLSRFWRAPISGIDLLVQSLLIAAICLLILLLLTLLRSPIKAHFRKSRPKRDSLQVESQNEESLSSIVINADTVIADKTQLNDDVSDKIVESIGNHDHGTDAISAKDDQSHTMKFDAARIASVLPVHGEREGTHRLDETISRTNAANDQTSVQTNIEKAQPVDPFNNLISDVLLSDDARSTVNNPLAEQSTELSDSLDLSDSEKQFAEMRSEHTEIELPAEYELKEANQRAAMGELDFDSTLVQEHNDSAANLRPSTLESNKDLIEEAEVLDVDDAKLSFGNDQTGEYAHPTSQADTFENFADIETAQVDTAKKISVPATLEDAMVAAKESASSLQAQVSNLEDTIVELDGYQDFSMNAAHERQKQLENSTVLSSCEDETRRAAEEVIAAQNAVIDRATRQRLLVDSQLKQERLRLSAMQLEVERSKKMARAAALLARKATVAQQEIREVAMREQNARLKSQESTRKAVTIARNAINALAAEERKRDLTNPTES